MGHLQILFWGFLTLSIDDEKNQRPNVNLLFKSLICSISNTALAIIKLSIDGLEYQSTILLRNLNEACFILLNIIISPEKRVALFESAKDEKGYEVWRKYFTFNKLNETISNYEKTITEDGKDILEWDWRAKDYKDYSGFVHNNFFQVLLYNYSLPQGENKVIELNLWGTHATRTEKIIESMNGLLWFTSLFFCKLITDPKIDVTPKSLCNEKDTAIWETSIYFHLITNEYYTYILEMNRNK